MTITELFNTSKQAGLNVFSDEHTSLMSIFFEGVEQVIVKVFISEDGFSVGFYVYNFLKLTNAVNTEAVLSRIVKWNYDYNYIKCAVDDTDGEIRLSIEIPLFDGKLASEQVDACFWMLANFAKNMKPRLQELISKGTYPEEVEEEVEEEEKKEDP